MRPRFTMHCHGNAFHPQGEVQSVIRQHAVRGVKCAGLNQVAAVILAAKKVIFVGGLRELELEADCSGVVCTMALASST